MLMAFKDWFHLHYQLLKDFVPSVVALIGIALTFGIAIAGFRSFGRWKREKIEERRIEVALDALAIAYEAGFRFESIRSPFFREDDDADIDAPSGDPSRFIVHREEQRSPYVVLKRMRESHDFFKKVFDIEPNFMAIFGAETEQIFSQLYDAQKIVEASAQALYEEAGIEHDPSDHYAHHVLGRTLERAGRFREALPHLRLAAAMKRHADYDDAVRRVEEWLGKSEPA